VLRPLVSLEHIVATGSRGALHTMFALSLQSRDTPRSDDLAVPGIALGGIVQLPARRPGHGTTAFAVLYHRPDRRLPRGAGHTLVYTRERTLVPADCGGGCCWRGGFRSRFGASSQ
jgi:hypothetical protein